MSAFDRLLAGSSGSAAPSGSSQTSNDSSSPLPPLNKAEKRWGRFEQDRPCTLASAPSSPLGAQTDVLEPSIFLAIAYCFLAAACPSDYADLKASELRGTTGQHRKW
ncbi:hypothetical protein WJX82_007812 [Trebouxia sp. C0006]